MAVRKKVEKSCERSRAALRSVTGGDENGLGSDYFDSLQRERMTKGLVHRLERFGFHVDWSTIPAAIPQIQ